MSRAFFLQGSRKRPPKLAECCPEKPSASRGLCAECHAARIREARTIKGQLRAAREGLGHAREVAEHFTTAAVRAPEGSVEAEHATDLAGEWQRRISTIKAEIKDLEARRDERTALDGK
jgi:hypothetical protein